MTPLVDVVFLLLIFFLVTSVFKKEELALLLNLPSAEKGEKVMEKREISIELSENSVALNGVKLDMIQLDSELSKVTEKNRPVLLRIDRSVRYERIIDLFNTLKKYGLNNLVLVEEVKR